MVRPLWKTVWKSLIKLNIHLPHNTQELSKRNENICLCLLYTNVQERFTHKSPNQRQFKCLSTSQQIHKLQIVIEPCNRKLFSLKKDCSHLDGAKNMKTSERSQSHRNAFKMIPFMKLQEREIYPIVTESRQMVACSLGWGLCSDSEVQQGKLVW